jgi:benzylsuccinate CoA-transferase BbsE subunit
MGATVVMLEPEGGSPLRLAPPLLDGGKGESALFAYLAAGNRSLICDIASDEGQALFDRELAQADILIEDVPLKARAAEGLTQERIAERFPSLVHVSVRPFGASGPKADWAGAEINLVHASGEGFLLPNGLSYELFPDRAPLKIYGHFASYQGGCMAALSALSAWWAVAEVGGQYVDVSVQDAMLATGAFALQRLGDGSLEHRETRRFRYGGVFEVKDGFIELLTLENRQWDGLVKLLGNPAWTQEEALQDPLERSRRGDEINHHVREWMIQHEAEEIVIRAQKLGVPVGKYRDPDEVLHGAQERARGLFVPLELADGSEAEVLLAPFQFRETPFHLNGGVPTLDEMARAAREQEAAA